MRNRNPNGIQQHEDGRIFDKYGRRYELDGPYFERLVAAGDQRAWYKALKNYGDPDRPPLKKRGPKPGNSKSLIKEIAYLHAMKIPDFFYAQDLGERPGAGFVISTDRPYFIGRVVQAKTQDKLIDYMVQRGIDKYYAIEGFPVAIVPFDSMEPDDVTPMTRDFFYRSMAEFYKNNKIKGNERYYKRYESKDKGA